MFLLLSEEILRAGIATLKVVVTADEYSTLHARIAFKKRSRRSPPQF